MNSLGTVFNVLEQFKNCSLIKNKISQGIFSRPFDGFGLYLV